MIGKHHHGGAPPRAPRTRNPRRRAGRRRSFRPPSCRSRGSRSVTASSANRAAPVPRGRIRARALKPRAFATAAFALSLASGQPALAEMCREYRNAIDAFRVSSRAVLVLDDTLEAARSGLRATREVRNALEVLDSSSTREMLEDRSPGASAKLDSADGASAEAFASFEAIHELVKAHADERSSISKSNLEAARVAADTAAGAALDSLSKLKAIPRRGALKAASASVSASPGRTTTNALLAVHESIYGAACM